MTITPDAPALTGALLAARRRGFGEDALPARLIATLTGCSQQAIMAWETGARRRPTRALIDTLDALDALRTAAWTLTATALTPAATPHGARAAVAVDTTTLTTDHTALATHPEAHAAATTAGSGWAIVQHAARTGAPPPPLTLHTATGPALWLRCWRRTVGWSASDAATAAQLTAVPSIHRMENGTRAPAPAFLTALLTASTTLSQHAARIADHATHTGTLPPVPERSAPTSDYIAWAWARTLITCSKKHPSPPPPSVVN